MEFFKDAKYKQVDTSKKSDAPNAEIKDEKEGEEEKHVDTIEDPEWEKKYPEPLPEGRDDEFWMAIIKPGANK